jgi:hypothetical protein
MSMKRLGPIWGAVILLVAMACSDANVIGPENQLEVANNPGVFEWQVTALNKVTQTLTYSWTNPGATGNVNQASSLGSGSATVRVTDGSGAEVYTRSLSENGTYQTSAGTTGTWTVVVTLDEASGTLNFRLNAP